jgi:hypothetical protein
MLGKARKMIHNPETSSWEKYLKALAEGWIGDTQAPVHIAFLHASMFVEIFIKL